MDTFSRGDRSSAYGFVAGVPWTGARRPAERWATCRRTASLWRRGSRTDLGAQVGGRRDLALPAHGTGSRCPLPGGPADGGGDRRRLVAAVLRPVLHAADRGHVGRRELSGLGSGPPRRRSIGSPSATRPGGRRTPARPRPGSRWRRRAAGSWTCTGTPPACGSPTGRRPNGASTRCARSAQGWRAFGSTPSGLRWSAAAEPANDFGALFAGFQFVLFASALLLVALQASFRPRRPHPGVRRASSRGGGTRGRVIRLVALEGALLALAGAVRRRAALRPW